MTRRKRGEKEKILDKWNGYVFVYEPKHPRAHNGRVAEQTLVFEAYIGRTLLPTEVVHHINGIKIDNRIENLMLMDKKEHKKLHAKMRGLGTKIQSHPARDISTGRFAKAGVR